jgi:hypothetical protein
MSDVRTLAEYFSMTHKTAVYPGSGTVDGLVYVSLGLIGEAGEVAENVKKSMRDNAGVLTPERRRKIAREIGDVMWYVSEALRCLGDDVPADGFNVSDGTLYVHVDGVRGVYQADALFEPVLVLAAAASDFASDPLREDGKALESLEEICHMVNEIARAIGVSFVEVLNLNLEKLSQRAVNGTIGGDGSDR